MHYARNEQSGGVIIWVDAVTEHRPASCRRCGHSLRAAPSVRMLGRHQVTERREVLRAGLRRALVPLRARLGRLLAHGDRCDDPKVAGFSRNLRSLWPLLWTFTEEEVEPTNNQADLLRLDQWQGAALRRAVAHRE